MVSGPIGIVCLYDGIVQDWFDLEAVRDYLARWLPWVGIEKRNDLLIDCSHDARVLYRMFTLMILRKRCYCKGLAFFCLRM